MMLPRDFAAAYGMPTVRHINVTDVGQVLVQPSLDRYLIGFGSSTASVTIGIGMGSDGLERWLITGPTNVPFLLTHALHGGLVMMGFRAVAFAPGAEIVIVEGYMRPVRNRHGRED